MTTPDPTPLQETLDRTRGGSAGETLEATYRLIADAEAAAPLRAWILLFPEQAGVEAGELDEPAAEREHRPLFGPPVGVKDVIAVAGGPLTASSSRIPPVPRARSSVAWQRLTRAGAVAFGHSHTHEFAAGSTTNRCGNPWDTTRSAGGSSGGSAAAVASGAVPVALGTDTAGSLRIPAALCGISSFKPTRGLVPNLGSTPWPPRSTTSAPWPGTSPTARPSTPT